MCKFMMLDILRWKMYMLISVCEVYVSMRSSWLTKERLVPAWSQAHAAKEPKENQCQQRKSGSWVQIELLRARNGESLDGYALAFSSIPATIFGIYSKSSFAKNEQSTRRCWLKLGKLSVKSANSMFK